MAPGHTGARDKRPGPALRPLIGYSSVGSPLRRLIAERRLLATIPGVGPITVAMVGDPSQFRNGRHFAAWLGLVPKQNGTGGKMRLGRISKMGDRYLRKLLVCGATSGLGRARAGRDLMARWTRRLTERRAPRGSRRAVPSTSMNSRTTSFYASDARNRK